MKAGLYRMTWTAARLERFIDGKTCKLCGEPATALVIGTATINPVCEKHTQLAKELGYDVVTAETEPAAPQP